MSKEDPEHALREVTSTVAFVARTNLQLKKDESEANRSKTRRAILTAFQARMAAASRGSKPASIVYEPEKAIAAGDLPAIGIPVSHIAAFMWLEALGDTDEFPITSAGYVVPLYTCSAGLMVPLLDRANSDIVVKTLEECQQHFVRGESTEALEEAMLWVFSKGDEEVEEFCEKASKVVAAFGKLVAGGVVAAAPSVCKEVAAMLKDWQKAWACHGDMDKWHKARFERRDICKILVDCSKLFAMRADAFSWSSENQDVWLDREEGRLLRFSAQCRKRKAEEDPSPETAGVNGEEEGGEEEEEEEEEVEVEDEEKVKLKEQVAALTVALDKEKASLAALTVSLDKEKAAVAALQGTFDTEVACQICLTSPRNVVLLPCRHGQFCSPCILKHQKVRNYCPTCMTAIKAVITCVGS